MQRNIPYQKTLSGPILTAALWLYPALGALYPLLPPLLGIAYLKWRSALAARNYPAAAVWMVYALIFESVWSLPLYGVWLCMIVMYNLFDPKLRQTLFDGLSIDFVSVLLFDLLYWGFLLFYESLLKVEAFEGETMLLYYLLCDLAGVFLI